MHGGHKGGALGGGRFLAAGATVLMRHLQETELCTLQSPSPGEGEEVQRRWGWTWSRPASLPGPPPQPEVGGPHRLTGGGFLFPLRVCVRGWRW